MNNKKTERLARYNKIEKLHKIAQDFGILQHNSKNVMEHDTRDQYTASRGGEAPKELYGVGLPERKNTDLSTKVYSRSLSTRYSPDRVGVQAARVSDGVYRDPITNKTYDWNEGFTTEDGSKFFGGNVSLQTDIIYNE